MSESKEDGGAAFPRPSSEGGGSPAWAQNGMSLRDYFAGQAVTGIMLHEVAYSWAPDGIASRAYKIADALLKARHG